MLRGPMPSRVLALKITGLSPVKSCSFYAQINCLSSFLSDQSIPALCDSYSKYIACNLVSNLRICCSASRIRDKADSLKVQGIEKTKLNITHGREAPCLCSKWYLACRQSNHTFINLGLPYYQEAKLQRVSSLTKESFTALGCL